jgi:hypothetical protein
MSRNKSKEFTVKNYQRLALAMTAASRIPAMLTSKLSSIQRYKKPSDAVASPKENCSNSAIVQKT